MSRSLSEVTLGNGRVVRVLGTGLEVAEAVDNAEHADAWIGLVRVNGKLLRIRASWVVLIEEEPER